MLTAEEQDAVVQLKLLEQAEFGTGEAERATAALRTLRARDAWARRGRGR